MSGRTVGSPRPGTAVDRRPRQSVRLVLGRVVRHGSDRLTLAVGGSALLVAAVATVLTHGAV